MKDGGKALGGVSSSEVAESLSYTFAVDETKTLTVDATYSGIFFDIEHEKAAPMVERLQSIGTSVRMDWAKSEKWSYFGQTGVSLNNAGNSFNSDGLNLSLALGLIHPFGESSVFIFGLAMNTMASDSLFVMPIIGLQTQFSPEWSATLGIPKTAITWKASDKLSLSMLVEGSGGAYYVSKSDLTMNAGSKDLGNSEMEYTDVCVGINLEYAFCDTCSLSVTGGYLLARWVDFYDRDYDFASDGGSVYGSIGITARF